MKKEGTHTRFRFSSHQFTIGGLSLLQIEAINWYLELFFPGIEQPLYVVRDYRASPCFK